ncbi:IS1 family transposase [uncultured Fluviicola sp.]|uniref:IS1 family transposase n=1 Tax=uncultured Fluviicola sp. TaxID=463303 RepID=UPI0025E7AF83|nr:IS1 family transposase [uncultured Fluviicola sp.]
MNCHYCHETCIRKGKQKTVQIYQCKSCLKYQRQDYKYRSKLIEDQQLIQLVKEGCGIRSIARVLTISNSTVLRRILKIGRSIKRSPTVSFGQTYQVDELFTYIGNKNNRVCVAYSLNAKTKEVIDLVVGRRNKTNLKRIISTLLLSDAKQITTDKLNIYKELIPVRIHSTKNRGINHIERQNLNLRTHIKRLNRRTICYSKSATMLLAVVKIYFWS